MHNSNWTFIDLFYFYICMIINVFELGHFSVSVYYMLFNVITILFVWLWKGAYPELVSDYPWQYTQKITSGGVWILYGTRDYWALVYLVQVMQEWWQRVFVFIHDSQVPQYFQEWKYLVIKMLWFRIRR